MRAGGTATLQEYPHSACPFPTSLGMWIPRHFLLRPFRALGISVSDTQAFGLGYCISPLQGFRATTRNTQANERYASRGSRVVARDEEFFLFHFVVYGKSRQTECEQEIPDRNTLDKNTAN